MKEKIEVPFRDVSDVNFNVPVELHDVIDCYERTFEVRAGINSIMSMLIVVIDGHTYRVKLTDVVMSIANAHLDQYHRE